MSWVEPKGQKFRGCYRDADQRVRKTGVFSTERAARRAAQDEEARLRAGTWADPVLGKMTLTAYVTDPETGWLKNRRGERTTKDTHASLWRAVEPVFGHLELRRIRPSLVQAWVNDMDAQGVHPKTIQNRYGFLRTVLAAKKGASAMRDGLLTSNPCEGVDLPHVPRRAVTVYQPDEADRVIAALPEYWRPLVLFAAETGMRWGELMGLTVQDFELDYRFVNVSRTIVHTVIDNTGNGTPFMWKDWPKGKKPRRVRLTPPAQECIRMLVAEHRLTPTDRIFSMPEGPRPNRRVAIELTDRVIAAAGEFLANNGRTYRHATVNGYQTGGCRCRLCRQASSDYRYSRLSTAVQSCRLVPKRTDGWPDGLPVDRGFFRSMVWRPANDAAGLEPLRFHDLRASHVSWLLAKGVDLPTVMERVGHEDFNTTLRYAKALDDADDKVLKAMASLGRGAPAVLEGRL